VLSIKFKLFIKYVDTSERDISFVAR